MRKNSRQITVAEMAPHVHSFGVNENKTEKIFCWLKLWIESSLKRKIINYGDRLPIKGDLAFHIGVSLGTIQNVFRMLEDVQIIESKQRIGSFIKNPNTNCGVEKMTSKKDFAIESIKNYIKENNLQSGDVLLSTRKLGRMLNLSGATIRAALNNLVLDNILIKKENNFIINSLEFITTEIRTKSLSEKVAERLQNELSNISNAGRIPSNKELAKYFGVSIKTIHDAVKILTKMGILYSRRGQYGTMIIKNAENKMYFYEEIELKIKHYIAQNSEIGSKLPSMVEFAKMFDVSTKTIKKALNNLAYDGYVTFTRGRYGGTFVVDIPQSVNESYKWLAIASDYVLESEN